MPIYVPDRHFELKLIPWNAEVARSEARRIVNSTARAYSETPSWKPHPLDDPSGSLRPLPTLYMGMPGCAWGLAEWSRLTGDNLTETFDPIVELKKWIETQSPVEDSMPARFPTSLFFGKLGDLLALESLSPSETNRQRLEELLMNGLSIDESSASGELMAGIAGGLVTSVHLAERSAGAPSVALKRLIREHIDRLFATWKWHDDAKAFLWRQNYGRIVWYIGAAHGSVGNVYALLRARPFLTLTEYHLVIERTVQFLERLAIRDESDGGGGGGGVNWPAFVGQGQERDPVLHWCHGSPGILMMLTEHMPIDTHPEFERLLLDAGELTYHAGSLKKGASTCHGTAGSGAACLKLFERTQDEMWLKRARLFAMNAIEQVREHEHQYGQLRYSLWTGDPGVALFLEDCIRGKYRMPLLDMI